MHNIFRSIFFSGRLHANKAGVFSALLKYLYAGGIGCSGDAKGDEWMFAGHWTAEHLECTGTVFDLHQQEEDFRGYWKP